MALLKCGRASNSFFSIAFSMIFMMISALFLTFDYRTQTLDGGFNPLMASQDTGGGGYTQLSSLNTPGVLQQLNKV
jgi:hypothetical protein